MKNRHLSSTLLRTLVWLAAGITGRDRAAAGVLGRGINVIRRMNKQL